MNSENHFQAAFDNATQMLQRIRQHLNSVIIGQSSVIDQTMVALIAGGHILLEGVPGTGKTLLVRALAKSFGGSFNRIQFTPDLMPSDITGSYWFNGKEQVFVLRQGPIFANLLLADEINRAPQNASRLIAGDAGKCGVVRRQNAYRATTVYGISHAKSD